MSNIAIFPGSFDPITNAHVDIIERALPLFDKIYIAIGVNSSKKPYIELETKKAILEEVFKGKREQVIIDSYQGLTVDYCKKVGAKFILRGMRSAKDFEFEQPISQNNQLLNESVQTIFLISSPGYGHISSTIVRDIHSNGGDLGKLVPQAVIDHLDGRDQR